jgi:hypothetical protein
MTLRAGPVVAALIVLLAATGCSSANSTAARDAAVRFSQAVAVDDTATACDLLAPKTKSDLVKSAGMPCPEALAEEGLPDAGEAHATEAFGAMAQVRFDADVLFLAEFRGGWKILAAGCQDRPERPYDCTVGG